jgi:hypothetical protein
MICTPLIFVTVPTMPCWLILMPASSNDEVSPGDGPLAYFAIDFLNVLQAYAPLGMPTAAMPFCLRPDQY